MARSTDLPNTNPWTSYASYEVAEPEKDTALNVHELSMKAIEEYVSQGLLTDEEVYEAEKNSEHPRESVLRKYRPRDEK